MSKKEINTQEESQIDTYKLESEHQVATAIVEANMAEFEAERQELKEKEREERETQTISFTINI